MSGPTPLTQEQTLAALAEQMGMTPAELAQAQVLLESDAVNLDEVIPEPVTVPLREYIDLPAEAGQPRRRKLQTRQAVIETYVPLDLYDGMLQLRGKVLALMSAANAAKALAATLSDPAESLAASDQAQAKQDDANRQMLALMIEMVWKVWILTEPDMTLQALQQGLGIGQVKGLFQSFFGGLARQITSSPATGVPGSPATATLSVLTDPPAEPTAEPAA